MLNTYKKASDKKKKKAIYDTRQSHIGSKSNYVL